jgi:hypothetical protein
MLISNLLKKLQNDPCAKSYQRKSDRKIEFLTFITVCKSFRPVSYNFFWVNCFAFFQRIRNQYRILRFMVTTSNFCKKVPNISTKAKRGQS